MEAMTFQQVIESRLLEAFAAAGIELPEGFKAQVVQSADLRFGDYQANSAMALAKRLRMNPSELATQVVEALQVEDLATTEIAGPGFINFRIKPEAWAGKVAELLGDERLGVEKVENPENIVVDFSAPNVAKPMHVGHIRSTIIGDSLSRISRFLGHNVITDNHIGDWGTQFGMVIYGWKNLLDEAALEADPLQELLRLYRGVNALCKEDEAVKDQCREELVKLQSGDQENYAIWEKCVEVSKLGLDKIYDRLEVTFDHWLGESYYNDALAPLVETMEKEGMARESDGALCVFSGGEGDPGNDPFKEKRDGEWSDLPMIIRKRDGGFNYATTDIATVDYRLQEWNADKIWYVVDARQGLHFKQLFDVSKRRGCKAELKHVSFGTILGKDGKPLKTRDGDLPQLEDVLSDAIKQSRIVLEEKSGHLEEEEKEKLAEVIGLGAVKFTELSHHRASDYIFDLEKMVALQGDTAPYLQYSYVRVRSIFRKLEEEVVLDSEGLTITEDGEIHLSRILSRFGEVLPSVLDDLRPNILANYLLDLAKAFHSFFEACPVLKSEGEVRKSRLVLCELTARVLEKGLGLLGINVPERM
ncbi:arginine--tRNA ligase [Rubritalea halochordaticola]|uniref:Arginine--tRNA ligase n=2 Tax=Rubritalea halochordaticola TaxID=714537 RepID=A0ABP9V6H0_9BACT